jgi:predicted DNA-binding protein (MmcQ/YjbR family)
MPTQADVRRFALSLPMASEAPHFEATSFRVAQKIFCTMGERPDVITLKFTPEDQHNLAEADPRAIASVAGYWGRKGWTDVRIEAIAESRLEALLRMSWAIAAPRSLAKKTAADRL